MNSHVRKTHDALIGHPAPRDLDWNDFLTMWKDLADKVENESGDRLSVTMNGHREVFRRPHDGTVGIEDVERARHLLRATPELKGQGHLYAIAVDAKEARLYDFDLDTTTVEATEHTERDHDPRGHHLRTVEKKTGRDDEADLDHYFEQLATAALSEFGAEPFVVFGHGAGKADVARGFVQRLEKEDGAARAAQVVAIVDIDLSAAGEPQLEDAARKAFADFGRSDS